MIFVDTLVTSLNCSPSWDLPTTGVRDESERWRYHRGPIDLRHLSRLDDTRRYHSQFKKWFLANEGSSPIWYPRRCCPNIHRKYKQLSRSWIIQNLALIEEMKGRSLSHLVVAVLWCHRMSRPSCRKCNESGWVEVPRWPRSKAVFDQWGCWCWMTRRRIDWQRIAGHRGRFRDVWLEGQLRIDRSLTFYRGKEPSRELAIEDDTVEDPRYWCLWDLKSAESFSQTTLAVGRSLGCCTQHWSTIC